MGEWKKEGKMKSKKRDVSGVESGVEKCCKCLKF